MQQSSTCFTKQTYAFFHKVSLKLDQKANKLSFALE